MSIAVRVSVWVLGVLLLVSIAVAVLALVQKQKLDMQNQGLQSQVAGDHSNIADLMNQTKQLKDQVQDLNNKILQAQQEKSQVQSQYDQIKQKSDDLQSQLTQANSDRDDWKTRVDTITKERNNLLEKLKNPPVKIVYKERVVRVPAAVAAENASGDTASAPDVASGTGDQYWAAVLRQKAALAVQLQKAKFQLDNAALQVADLKKQNTDLQVEIKQITNEKDEIVQKIKYGQDLADNLSVDLARSRNDQEAVNERADKLKGQNLDLLSQIRDLSSTKVELEKNISSLTNDKDQMQKKLVETESVIQNRIDDIWKIKQSLDKKLSENAVSGSSDSGVELPPIIVNAPASAGQQQAAMQQGSTATMAAPAVSGKTQGQIISINEPNNFIIADLGQQNSSIAVGNSLKVYRDSAQIADLEVIQVRRDICAADIKDRSTELKVGDTVRFQ